MERIYDVPTVSFSMPHDFKNIKACSEKTFISEQCAGGHVAALREWGASTDVFDLAAQHRVDLRTHSSSEPDCFPHQLVSIWIA